MIRKVVLLTAVSLLAGCSAQSLNGEYIVDIEKTLNADASLKKEDKSTVEFITDIYTSMQFNFSDDKFTMKIGDERRTCRIEGYGKPNGVTCEDGEKFTLIIDGGTVRFFGNDTKETFLKKK
jgi:hypothetical protein